MYFTETAEALKYILNFIKGHTKEKKEKKIIFEYGNRNTEG